MAVFQDVLKNAFDATGNYETSLNKAFSMFNKPTMVDINNQEYTVLTRPKVYQNSIDPSVKDFKHSELSFNLLNTHDINSTSVGGGYNNWASTSTPKTLDDQYKDMYDYLMNIDAINIKGPVSDEDMDYLHEKMVKAKKNKTHRVIDYSGEGYNNAINFLNNRAQTDVPTPPPESAVNVANNTSTPIDNLNKLLNKTNPEKRMWVNRDFVFGDNYINNKDFNRAVTEFYTNTENAGKLFEKITKFSDLEYSSNDFKIYENMFDTYKRATGQTTKEVQQQIIDQFKEWKVSPEEMQKHFRLIKEAAEEVGWQGNYEHLDYSSFKIDDVIETRKNPKLKNADKSYRPEVTMNGNNVEIDSIYNHSVPRRIHNSNNTHSPEQNELDQEINRTEAEHRQRTSSTSTSEPDVNTPDPESYTPKIGDNIIDDTGERYVLKEIDEANPSLDIHSDTYYYVSPNGDRITQSKPIDPTNPNGKYFLDDEILTPDDVYKINHSFEELRMNYDNYEQAKGQLYNLKDAYENGADNLNEIYEMEKSVRYLEKKLAETRKQIYDDDVKYNSGDKWAYNINEKTQKYIDQTDNVLKDYSETKYHNNYDEAFKDVKPRQLVNTIEPGIDDTFKATKGSTVENNIKTRTRTRGKKKNVQTTGRGNRKTRTQSTGRSNKIKKTKVKSSGGKDLPNLKRRGKSSKLRAVGRNGKVLNNIPRKIIKSIPLDKDDILETAANIVINEAATDTASTIIKNVNNINAPDVDNAPHPDSPNIPSSDNPIPDPDHSNTPDPDFEVPDGYGDDPSTWTDEDIEDMADGDPDLYKELKKRREEAFNNNVPETHTNTPEPEVNSEPQGEPIPPKPFSKNFDPNDPDTWTRDDIERMNNPSAWTDDDIRRLADGDADYADELINRRKAGSGGPSNKLPDEFDFNDAPIPERNKIDTPDTKMFDEDGLPQGISKMDIAMTGLNIIGAVGDYKSARREGHGVVSSAVRAGVKLAVDEALGWWALPIGIVKTLPGMAIKGADMLYKENRRMNSAANFQVFGDAQFMDTQQLATMRQSGMEMAKMAQYNLQQTLMGSEAKYLHR